MQDIVLKEQDKSAFSQTMDYVRDWCSEHQWEVGLAEMAAGAAIVAYGVQNGAIEMGKDMIGTAFAGDSAGAELAGAGTGAALGGAGAAALKVTALGGSVLGSVGVAAAGSAISIPAALIIGGGALILGGAGYAAADQIEAFLNPPIHPGEFFTGCSMLAIGTALLVDGARRVITDDRVLSALSTFKDGVLHLAQVNVDVLARSLDDLKGFMKELASVPNTATDATASAAAAAGLATAGAVAGSAAATASVTILGSQALGGVAISLGLVSAPLWPVIAGGAAGIVLGYTGWKACTFWGGKALKDVEDQPSTISETIDDV